MLTLEDVSVYIAYPYPLVLFIAVISKRLDGTPFRKS